VFLNRKGALINEDWPRRVFAKVLTRAGLSWHIPYDLRHTFATLHLAKGHPITYVSAQLGHSDPSTTLRWYAHWLPISDKRFADALDSPAGGRVPRVGVDQPAGNCIRTYRCQAAVLRFRLESRRSQQWVSVAPAIYCVIIGRCASLFRK